MTFRLPVMETYHFLAMIDRSFSYCLYIKHEFNPIKFYCSRVFLVSQLEREGAEGLIGSPFVELVSRDLQ